MCGFCGHLSGAVVHHVPFIQHGVAKPSEKMLLNTGSKRVLLYVGSGGDHPTDTHSNGVAATGMTSLRWQPFGVTFQLYDQVRISWILGVGGGGPELQTPGCHLPSPMCLEGSWSCWTGMSLNCKVVSVKYHPCMMACEWCHPSGHHPIQIPSDWDDPSPPAPSSPTGSLELSIMPPATVLNPFTFPYFLTKLNHLRWDNDIYRTQFKMSGIPVAWDVMVLTDSFAFLWTLFARWRKGFSRYILVSYAYC